MGWLDGSFILIGGEVLPITEEAGVQLIQALRDVRRSPHIITTTTDESNEGALDERRLPLLVYEVVSLGEVAELHHQLTLLLLLQLLLRRGSLLFLLEALHLHYRPQQGLLGGFEWHLLITSLDHLHDVVGLGPATCYTITLFHYST